jgi:hypothetical protein
MDTDATEQGWPDRGGLLDPQRVTPSDHAADSTREALKINASRLYDEQLHVLLEKNVAYSPLNISMAPFGVMEGLVTRISDKYWRIVNLVESPGEVRFESLEDSFGDLMNYAAISTLCLRGQWPGVARGGVRP